MPDTKISALTLTTLFQGDDDVPVSDVTNTTNKRWPVKSIGGMTRRTITAADTLVASDRGKVVEATSGTFSVGTTAAATLLDGWWAILFNNGTGLVTLDPNGAETINGATTLILANGCSVLVWTDGANFFGLGLVDPQQLTLREIAAPAAPAANRIRIYAFDNGAGAQIRTKDEYGLIDVLSLRDAERIRRHIFAGVGSDVGSAGSDFLAYGVQFLTLEGTIGVTQSALDGHAKNLLTAATVDADAGFPGGFVMFERNTNPDITFKFRVNSTAVRRVWIGFMEADHMASDSTAATHKFALRLSTAPAVTGFTIVHSDGTTETVEAQIQASDTTIHTIRLIADAANARFGYSFDGAAIVWITANIPAATADLGIQCEIRTLEAVSKNMDVWWIDGTVDK